VVIARVYARYLVPLTVFSVIAFAPLLVFAGHLMGRPLGLEFTILEVAAVMLSVGTMTLLIRDGRTNWFEGLQLLAVYGILAMAFYFI